MRSIEKLLKKEGYNVVSTRSGHEAIKQVQEQDFDLLITDIRMPNLNGIETICRIREVLKSRGGTPVREICITGYADTELNQKAEQLGVSGYLYKPFDLRDFLDCVRRNIQG